MNLPDGFYDLVELYTKSSRRTSLPKSVYDVWDALIYPLFLGENTRSAQASYVCDMLHNDFLTYRKAKKALNDPSWSKKVASALNHRLSSIKGSNAEGYKRAILALLRNQAERGELIETITSAIDFFNIYKPIHKYIDKIKKDTDAQKEFVVLSARGIFNVGIIKSVIWLYSCGIGKEIVPPTSHIRRFLSESGISYFDWSLNGMSDEEAFAPACRYISDIANSCTILIGKKITPKEIQNAVWYYETCKSLIAHSKLSKHLTPRNLIQYLNSNNWTLRNLGDIIDDIERIDDLSQSIKDFLKQLTRAH
jgi:hypothetical protein